MFRPWSQNSYIFVISTYSYRKIFLYRNFSLIRIQRILLQISFRIPQLHFVCQTRKFNDSGFSTLLVAIKFNWFDSEKILNRKFDFRRNLGNFLNLFESQLQLIVFLILKNSTFVAMYLILSVWVDLQNFNRSFNFCFSLLFRIVT